MSAESWMPIPRFDRYEVSDLGRVRNAQTGKLLKLMPQPSRYFQVGLTNRDGLKRLYVHRLVLLAFVGEPPEGHECMHANSERTDCRLVNLSWGTRRENIDTAKMAFGEAHGRAKLTSEDVAEIRMLIRDGVSSCRLAAVFGVSVGAIDGIRYGKSWTHIKEAA